MSVFVTCQQDNHDARYRNAEMENEKMSDKVWRLPLHAIAHGRAGDKGNVSNISVIAYDEAGYAFIEACVTEAFVMDIFSQVGATSVMRYLLPNLKAMNFVIPGVLDGGVNESRNVDRHGKNLSYLLLSRLMLDIPDNLLAQDSPYRTPEIAAQYSG